MYLYSLMQSIYIYIYVCTLLFKFLDWWTGISLTWTVAAINTLILADFLDVYILTGSGTGRGAVAVLHANGTFRGWANGNIHLHTVNIRLTYVNCIYAFVSVCMYYSQHWLCTCQLDSVIPRLAQVRAYSSMAWHTHSSPVLQWQASDSHTDTNAAASTRWAQRR